MWINNSTTLIYQFFPFAHFENLNYAPPYPIPENSHQVFPAKANIDKNQTSVETLFKQAEDNNVVLPEREFRFRKAKKQAKTRIIKRKNRQDSFEKKKQKKDRNLPSNICRFFVTFLYHHPSPHLILGPSSPQVASDIRSCITQLKRHIKEGQTYVRPCIIEAMCQGKLLNPSQSIVFRMLFKRFVKLQLKIVISTMRKLKKKEKVSYFKLANRFLKHFIGRK